MNKKLIIALSILFFFCCTPIFCETIKLKNGKTVEGKIVEKTNTFVKLNITGVGVTYYFDEVAEIKATQGTSQEKVKKTIIYQVTKKFYLKAVSDTHYLKFCMPLPQEQALRQKITDTVVFPKTNAFIKDDYGSDIPIFYFEFLKSATQAIIGVSYTVEFEAEPFTIEPSLIPDQYPPLDKSLEQYLASEKDINIQNPLIQEKMQSVTGSLKNPYEKAKALYDFVTGYIRYDRELARKVIGDSGYEPRKPTDTLQDGKGICYDIAKLYVALCRAAGIPARVARGIAFMPQEDTKKYFEEIGHAWAEIYLPKYGWQIVDPTFGISEKDAFFCFNNISHVAEEYGLANAKEFGSLEKGWALQIRSQTKLTRFPLAISEAIEIERVSD
ncbi:MAG: transglutaminase domain-containing protein [Candidatus Omnitrophota bacterium]|nr:transglutaminase domain-containing protein [Candidatus Omnitrophota bacterium]